MKRLIFSGTTVLVGDEIADAAVDYAAVLTRTGGADTIELRTLTPDGDPEESYLLLNSATTIMSQTMVSTEAEPNNDDALRYIRDAIRRLDPPGGLDWDIGPYT